MRKFEYKAVPAPTQGTKARGVKSTEDRFALSLTETLNDMAAEGWEYVRAETLPCDERKGLTGTQKTYQNVLIFRRFIAEALPLTGDRVVSRPLSHPVARPEPDEAPEAREPVQRSEPRVVSEPRAVSEPVTPRRVSTQLGSSNPPPLGAARPAD